MVRFLIVTDFRSDFELSVMRSFSSCSVIPVRYVRDGSDKVCAKLPEAINDFI